MVRPDIVSNSYLGVCTHVRQGGWSAIVPHTFAHLFDGPDILLLDLVKPAHSQAIGLVFSDRDPLSPMASALLHATKSMDVPEDFQARH